MQLVGGVAMYGVGKLPDRVPEGYTGGGWQGDPGGKLDGAVLRPPGWCASDSMLD